MRSESLFRRRRSFAMTASIATHSWIPFRARPKPPKDRLAEILDTHLLLSSRVRDFHPNVSSETVRLSALPEGSVIRSARIAHRILTVVAIPEGAETPPRFRRDLVRDLGTRDLLVVREAWLMRQPRLDTLEVLAGFAGCGTQSGRDRASAAPPRARRRAPRILPYRSRRPARR